MIEHNPGSIPEGPKITGRQLAIATVGAVAFSIELGPNAHTPEAITVNPETGPETGLEPARPLTDDEAAYVAGTLGSADTKSIIRPTLQ